MASGLERDTDLLEVQEISQWRQRLGAAAAGLITAGPLGVVASLVAFRKLEQQWLAWALVGVVAAPPLAYGQWRLLTMLSPESNSSISSVEEQLAHQAINEADQIARACALAVKTTKGSSVIANPLDGRALFCDGSYPTTVVITSKRFDPIQQARSCGLITLIPGTSATQWLVSPAGALACKAVARSWGWWSADAAVNRPELYRRCTENLRLEAQSGFIRTAHQLGRRDYCAEERALLARDQINNAP